MIITLDNQRIEVETPTPCTLQTLIDQIRATHENRLIISIMINGQTLGDNELAEQLGKPLNPDVQIDLESGESHVVARDALRGLALEFQHARTRHEAVADRLGAGESSAGIQDVGDFVALWQTTHRVLAQCSGLLNQDLTQVEHDGRTVQACFEEVVEQLSGIRDALEQRDMVMLSDVVRYELPTLCEHWQQVLEGVADKIAPGTATD